MKIRVHKNPQRWHLWEVQYFYEARGEWVGLVGCWGCYEPWPNESRLLNDRRTAEIFAELLVDKHGFELVQDEETRVN